MERELQLLQFLSWILILYLGAAVGSFLNVVVYRLPRGLSLLRPGSHCPQCKTPLGPTENIPIFGWIRLGGRCAHCGSNIAWRYPAVEALTMSLYGLCFGVLGFTPQAGLACICVSWLVALALIDLDTFLLLEELTQSGLVAGAVGQMALPWLVGHGSVQASFAALFAGIVGAVVGIWIMESIGWVAKLALGKEALGLGDGKLMAMVGMWSGWMGVLVTLMVGCLAGLLGSGIGLTLKRVQFGRPIPFGPYLAVGAVVALLSGSELVEGYLWLIGLG